MTAEVISRPMAAKAALQVTTEDPLPKRICSECYNLINAFYEFRLTCLKTNIILQNQYDEYVAQTEPTAKCRLKPLDDREPGDVCNTVVAEAEGQSFEDQSTEGNPNTCKICQHQFKSPTLLRYHSMVHTGERPHKCYLCGRKFRLLGQLKFHLKVHTGSSPYQCDVCGKVLLRPSDLAKHKRKHTGERPYCCSICNKKFSQLCGLKTHNRLHTNERPYKCSFCSKSFIQFVNKTKHERIHADGKKPYVCDVPHCGRSFIDLLEQELHRAGHDGGRPRKCTHCDMGFRTPSQLRDHIRRFHTNERPYKCNLCNKKFHESHALKLHSVVHTSQKPFQCKLCTQTFTQSGNYRRHLTSRHQNDCETSLPADSFENMILIQEVDDDVLFMVTEENG